MTQAQPDSEQAGIAAGLQNRIQQSAAVAEDRDEALHSPTKPTPSPYATTPQDKVVHQHAAPKGEKEMKKKAASWSLPLYDVGGKVNVRDGKHQVAIVKDGERVLTPSQNQDWEKDNPGARKAPMTLPIGGKTMRDANDVTPEIKPTPKAPLYDAGGSVDCYDKGGEHSPAEKKHFHRAMAHLHKGGLHDVLGIPHDQPIPLAKKEEAAHSSNKHTSAMGRLAVSMHGWSHNK